MQEHKEFKKSTLERVMDRYYESMSEYEEKPKHRIYASVCLSDGEILFWRVGQDAKIDVWDFNKDFYRASINILDYEKEHKLESKSMCFEFTDEDMNDYIFENIAREYFKYFPISKDSGGSKPY